MNPDLDLRTCSVCTSRFAPGDSRQAVCSVACMATSGDANAVRLMAGLPVELRQELGQPTGMFAAAMGIDPNSPIRSHRVLADRGPSQGKGPSGPTLVEKVWGQLDGFRRCSKPGCKTTFRDVSDPDRRTCGGPHDKPTNQRQITNSGAGKVAGTVARDIWQGFEATKRAIDEQEARYATIEAIRQRNRESELRTAELRAEIEARRAAEDDAKHGAPLRAGIADLGEVRRLNAMGAEIDRVKTRFGHPYPGTQRERAMNAEIDQVRARYGR